MELFQYRFHPDRISLQPRCQMRGDCRLIDVRTHLLQRLTDPRHCFYLKSIPRDQTAVRAPLIPAHCRLIVGRVRSALLQLPVPVIKIFLLISYPSLPSLIIGIIRFPIAAARMHSAISPGTASKKQYKNSGHRPIGVFSTKLLIT